MLMLNPHRKPFQLFLSDPDFPLLFSVLDLSRYQITLTSCHTLPPTTAAAEQHCKRTFYQVIEWTKRDEDLQLDPLDWGWTMSNGKLVPVKTCLPAAPDELINVIRCKCKSNCDNRRCSCRASTCSAFEQLRPLQSVQAVVHWRPCFRQEQRRLSQLDLHLQRMTFINSSGAAGRRSFYRN
jgi:hypothetical protein